MLRARLETGSLNGLKAQESLPTDNKTHVAYMGRLSIQHTV